MERKEFIKKFTIGGSILLTAPILFNSCSEDEMNDENEGNTTNPNEVTVDLENAGFSQLKNIGGYAYKGDIIIFRTSESSYMALSKLCTHSQCTVTYSHDNGDIPCPCHGSKFTTSGAVKNGPAATSLKKYTVIKEGNTLKIS